MSFEPDDVEHEESNIETLGEVVKWLKVVANILADMQGIDANELYEDLD